ncbi:MAG: hypothetical protein KDJ52_00250 [Anaerolineae bacterium]|nr:hypothetical protein [Anaerolineae bacterium]
MARPTVRDLKKKVSELLALQSAVERYKELEGDIKSDMSKLNYKEVVVEAGRVFISESERISVSTTLAESVLGQLLAEKVIVTKRTVSNELLKAFYKAGEIEEGDRERLLEQADRTPITQLYVRPLK